MKIARKETAHALSENLTVYFEPLALAGQYWRERGRTHSQAFRFTYDGREYWGEIVRTFDRSAPSGERVRVDVELRTRSGKYGRALPENQRVLWRAALRRQFARNLAAFVEAQGRNPEPVPAGPEVSLSPEAAAFLGTAESVKAACDTKPQTVTVETNWAAASRVIEIALCNGTGEGRRIAREELGRMAALADERNTLAGRIAEAAQRAREVRGGLSGGARDVVQGILASLDPAEPEPLNFTNEAMQRAACPVLFS